MSASANWKLALSYDGSGFHGWQIQPAQSGLSTVQGVLSDCLERLTGERVLPQGSGRTDAGVHALEQVCSFRMVAPVPPANLQRALNRLLPASIRVLSAEKVSPGFHARHSARSKVYEYRIFERCIRRAGSASGPAARPFDERICSPFLAPYAWDCRWPLELAPMQEAAALLLGTHNFTSMAATDPERGLRDADSGPAEDADDGPQRGNRSRLAGVHPVKTILQSGWRREDGLLIYRIMGDGFLHHMVRNLVGTLAEIGRGSLEPADLESILSARDRSAAGPTAPARGLYLVNVHYDDCFDQPSSASSPELSVGDAVSSTARAARSPEARPREGTS